MRLKCVTCHWWDLRQNTVRFLSYLTLSESLYFYTRMNIQRYIIQCTCTSWVDMCVCVSIYDLRCQLPHTDDKNERGEKKTEREREGESLDQEKWRTLFIWLEISCTSYDKRKWICFKMRLMQMNCCWCCFSVENHWWEMRYSIFNYHYRRGAFDWIKVLIDSQHLDRQHIDICNDFSSKMITWVSFVMN